MQAMIFHMILYRSEKWTLKKQDRKCIDTFMLCWKCFPRISGKKHKYASENKLIQDSHSRPKLSKFRHIIFPYKSATLGKIERRIKSKTNSKINRFNYCSDGYPYGISEGQGWVQILSWRKCM